MSRAEQVAWRSPTFRSATQARIELSDVRGDNLEHAPWHIPLPPLNPWHAVPSLCMQVSDEGLELRYPANYVDGLDCTDEKTAECAWASVSGVVRNATTERPMDDFAANATATIAADGRSLVLTYAQPPLPLGAEVHINHTAYGWGAVPLLSVYDKGTGLPVLPWSEESVGEALL